MQFKCVERTIELVHSQIWAVAERWDSASLLKISTPPDFSYNELSYDTKCLYTSVIGARELEIAPAKEERENEIITKHHFFSKYCIIRGCMECNGFPSKIGLRSFELCEVHTVTTTATTTTSTATTASYYNLCTICISSVRNKKKPEHLSNKIQRLYFRLLARISLSLYLILSIFVLLLTLNNQFSSHLSP